MVNCKEMILGEDPGKAVWIVAYIEPGDKGMRGMGDGLAPPPSTSHFPWQIGLIKVIARYSWVRKRYKIQR